MRIMINSVVDLTEIFTKHLIKYFNDDIKFGEIYPNFPSIRIGGDHPFTTMMENQIKASEGEKTVYKQDLFPSIVIADNSSGKDTKANLTALQEEYIITSEGLAQIKENRDVFIISDSNLDILNEHFIENPTSTFAYQASQIKQSNMVIEIWSENKKIKNIIFDLISNFLVMEGRFTLKSDYDIIIAEDSVGGEKEGNYNYDFGKTLHAGIFRYNVSYKLAQYLVSDVEIGAAVEVNINDLLV